MIYFFYSPEPWSQAWISIYEKLVYFVFFDIWMGIETSSDQPQSPLLPHRLPMHFDPRTTALVKLLHRPSVRVCFFSVSTCGSATILQWKIHVNQLLLILVINNKQNLISMPLMTVSGGYINGWLCHIIFIWGKLPQLTGNWASVIDQLDI